MNKPPLNHGPDPSHPPQERVHVALGSNLGNRQAELERALNLIDENPDIRVSARSEIYETIPEGPSDQLYLNMVAELDTTLEPFQLLDALMAIESRMGRVRTGRWSNRNIDLDIVLWGDTVMNASRLEIPHPRMHKREFVLRPLCALAPDAVHPIYKKTMRELLTLLGPQTAKPIRE